MRTAAAFILLATLAHAATARGGSPTAVTVNALVPRIEVRGARIHARDILGMAAPDVDLGPTPPLGSTRVVERAEIARAYAASNVTAPKNLPTAVRVSRKTRRLDPSEIDAAIRSAVGESALPRNAALAAVHATALEVPADFERVAVDLPTLPRRAGVVLVQAPIRILGEGGATLQKTTVPLEIHLPPEAAFADLAKGAPIALVIRRGLIELTVHAVTTADADVGSTVGVLIKPSGRVVRAHVVDKTHALALEDS